MQGTTPASDLPSGASIAATQPALTDNRDRLTQSGEQLNQTNRSMCNGRSESENLHEASYARLLTRLHTMPVIEQAKGILMAESRCSPEQAFAMLRAASQRSNVKVRDLAQEIVGRVSGAQSQSAAEGAPPAG